jgi:hypothetical protein
MGLASLFCLTVDLRVQNWRSSPKCGWRSLRCGLPCNFPVSDATVKSETDGGVPIGSSISAGNAACALSSRWP